MTLTSLAGLVVESAEFAVSAYGEMTVQKERPPVNGRPLAITYVSFVEAGAKRTQCAWLVPGVALESSRSFV